MEAECVRMRGALMLALRPDDADTAERLFREALTIAEAQGARSWALRAATDLARLRAGQGREAEARAILAPVYEGFTEGHDTPDLKAAEACLAGLA